jgi:WD repeat-containing protein 35
MLAQCSKDTVVLNNTLMHMASSLPGAKTDFDRVVSDLGGGDRTDYPTKAAEESLIEVLDMSDSWQDLKVQVADCMTDIEASIKEVSALREQTDVNSDHTKLQTTQSMMANTKRLNDLMRSNERSSNALDVMQLILGGTLAFQLLDRVTGSWSLQLGGAGRTTWADSFLAFILYDHPGLWACVNLVFFVLLALMLRLFLKGIEDRAFTRSLRIKFQSRIDAHNLRSYLQSKNLTREDLELEGDTSHTMVEWTETASSSAMAGITVQMELDYVNGVLWYADLVVPTNFRQANAKRGDIKLPYDFVSFDEIRDALFDELKSFSVLVDQQEEDKDDSDTSEWYDRSRAQTLDPSAVPLQTFRRRSSTSPPRSPAALSAVLSDGSSLLIPDKRRISQVLPV